MMRKERRTNSRKGQQDANVDWILSSPNPTPLAFFRILHPTHRVRAIEKYNKAFAFALSCNPDNTVLKEMNIDVCILSLLVS